MSKAIYILGGMGPQASLEFYRLVIDKAQSLYGAKANDDYPEITIHSIPVPDFISQPTNEEAALNMLLSRVESIDTNVFGTFAIACNTVHLLAPKLQEKTSVQFVSMIDEVAKTVAQKKVKKVGLLASPTTIRSGIYQAALARLGIEVVQPKPKQITEIEKAIRAVIASEDLTSQRKAVRDIAKDLLKSGAELVVLGCTELPIVYGDSNNNIVSSLNVLSEAMLKRYYKD